MKKKQNEAGRGRVKGSVFSSWVPLDILDIVCDWLLHLLKLSAKKFINYWVSGGKKGALVNIGHIDINNPHFTCEMDPLQIPIP